MKLPSKRTWLLLVSGWLAGFASFQVTYFFLPAGLGWLRFLICFALAFVVPFTLASVALK